MPVLPVHTLESKVQPPQKLPLKYLEPDKSTTLNISNLNYLISSSTNISKGIEVHSASNIVLPSRQVRQESYEMNKMSESKEVIIDQVGSAKRTKEPIERAHNGLIGDNLNIGKKCSQWTKPGL